jgi:hypothetical protein
MAAPSPTTDPSWLPAPTEPFWKPRLRDSVRYLGWRILLMLLAAALAVFIFLNMRWSRFTWAIALWKPIVMVIAIPILISISAMGNALRARCERAASRFAFIVVTACRVCPTIIPARNAAGRIACV